MKRAIGLFIAGILSLSAVLPVFSASANSAVPSPQQIFVNDIPSDMQAVNINGRNYMHIQAFAAFTGGLHIEITENAIAADFSVPYIEKAVPAIDYANLAVEENDKPLTINGVIFEEPVDIVKVNEDYYVSFDSAAMLSDSEIIFCPSDNIVSLEQNGGYEGIEILPYSYIQNKKDATAYLKENTVPLSDFNDAIMRLKEKDILLFGEAHASQKTYTAKINSIKAAHETYGVRDVFLEIGYSDAGLLNQYLASGDATILTLMLTNLIGTLDGNYSTYAYYEDIYAYNQTLPADQKLRIFGTDVQHQFNTGAYFLKTLLPTTAAPAEIQPALDFLAQPQADYKDDLNALIADHNEKKAQYQAYLGDDYVDFSFALDNMRQKIAHNEAENPELIRETFMIENFRRQFDALGGKKIIGFYGAMHTVLNQEETDGFQVMASALQEHYPDKIDCIKFEYIDSFIMKWDDPENPYTTSTNMYLSDIKASLTSDFSIVSLEKENSPFIVNGTAAMYPSIIIIKDSPAAEVYVAQ